MSIKTRYILLLIIVFLNTILGISQNTSDSTKTGDTVLIQFSGIILTADSLKGLPYATIINKNKKVGVISNLEGFFSLVVNKGDTIAFDYVGYHHKEYIVPDTLTEERYSIIQLMTINPVYLSETVVYPWNTKAQFKEAFIHTPIPADDLARAKNNLEIDRIKQLGKKMQTDPSIIADHYLKDYSNQFYYYGQAPPNNFLNPFAWARFFEAWQNGAFRQ